MPYANLSTNLNIFALCCFFDTFLLEKEFIRDGFQLETVLFRTDFYLAHRHFLAQ